MWLLRNGYDIVLEPEGDRFPLHEYDFSEFRRTIEKDDSSFFGFQTSKRSFLSNLVGLSLAFLLIYYGMPRWGLLRAIYGNTALSTVALLFAFLLVDQLLPLGLQGIVCLLSRLRIPVFFIRSKVKV
jgi:hypothetical protein